MSLNNLAICLSSRYNQLRTMEDLDEAIVLDREALDLATSVICSHGRGSYRIRRSCLVSTLDSCMCPQLCLPVTFLPLEHGSVWLKISSISQCFSHMSHLFDYLFNI